LSTGWRIFLVHSYRPGVFIFIPFFRGGESFSAGTKRSFRRRTGKVVKTVSHHSTAKYFGLDPSPGCRKLRVMIFRFKRLLLCSALRKLDFGHSSFAVWWSLAKIVPKQFLLFRSPIFPV
jgi:hypothetical protein